MKNVDLNLLYTLHMFVEQGSLAATATALSRSQPAISARLHQLQDDLGVPLFEKVGRRLQLTPVGRLVHAEAVAIVRQSQRIIEVAQSEGDVARGRVRIGVLPTVGVYVLAPRLAAFLSQCEQVQVELQYGLTSRIVDELFAGELDAVVSVGGPPSDDRVEVRTLSHVHPVVVGLPGTFPPTKPVEADSLRELPILQWTLANDPFFDRVSRFLAQANLTPNIRLQVGHIDTLKELVRHGAGIAILPDYTVADSGLDARPLPQLDLSQPMWLAWRKAVSGNRAVMAFLDQLSP